MYRTLDTKFWTDPKVRKLPATAKLLFIYLITNRLAHVSGIYVLPISVAASETGINKSHVDTLLDTLSGAGLVRIDQENELVWVKNMMGYQARGEKAERAAANHLASLHNSLLIKEFLKKYPSVSRFYKIPYPIPHPAQDQFGTQEQEQEQEKEQEQEQEQEKEQEQEQVGGDVVAYPIDLFISQWNAIEGISPCRSLNQDRRTAFRARWRETEWRANLSLALEKVAGSPFCRGENQRGWRATVDWFLRPGTLSKVIEGFYDERAAKDNSEDLFASSRRFVERGA